MKKKLAMLTAFALLLLLFAGCGGPAANNGAADGGGGNADGAAATDGGNTAAQPTEAATEEPDSPYNYAVGKYEVDDRGVPTAKYEYELPLTTTDEVFTYWTAPVLPDQIDVDNYEDMPFPKALREKTGVHIEYLLVDYATKFENCAALVASDSLPDLLSDLNLYFPGTLQSALDDEYIVNLYDYKEYMPNYYYCIWDHEDDIGVRASLMAADDVIYSFVCLNSEKCTSWGGAVRGDWLDKLGIKVDDIVTIDDLHELLVAFQSQMGAQYPFCLLNCLDAHQYFNAFDTITQYSATVAPPYVKDGKVQFADSGENDLKYMTLLNTWFNEGFISPNWMSWDGNITIAAELQTGVVGVCSMLPSEAAGYVDNEAYPDAYWTAIHEPVLYEGQVFHLGDTANWVGYGNWTISTNCENIPLLVTYCDYFYSDSGAFFANYGVEGYTFYYDESGKPMLTDFIVNNPSGSSWAILQFAMNDVYDGGILMRDRSYAMPGGDKLRAWYEVWDDPDFYRYDGSMAWPKAIQFSADDTNRRGVIGADIQTFIVENYLQFVDNSKPLSEWDSYVSQLTSMPGWNEALEIHQNAYDAFMERFS